MKQEYSYSHMGEGKGRAYDHEFRASPFLDYLWGREKELLRTLIRREKEDLSRPLRYLDFACGTGRILSVIEETGVDSVGLDISPSMMDEARTKVSRSRLVLGNFLEDPEVLGETFDVATAFRFFPNADDELRDAAAAFLAERVAPGGLLIVNNHQNWASLLCAGARVVGKSWPWRPTKNAEITDRLHGVGFVREGLRGFGLLPGTARRPYFPIGFHATVDGVGRLLGLGRIAQDCVMWFRRR